MNFEEIYQLYFKDVYLFVLAMSGDANIAEEITQETFFKVLKNIERFEGRCSVKTWLCQIGRNTYLSYQKKQKHFVMQPDNRGKIESASIQENDVEANYIHRDEARTIYKVLQKLDEPYKEVFTLRILGDLSYTEIGEIFGRKEGWARMTYHRAKLKIKEMIKEA